jgi:ribosomal-protein-alanine N-acetyltransferase
MSSERPAFTDPVLRAAVASDIDGILAIERAVFSDPWSASAFSVAMKSPSARVMIAGDATGVVGYTVSVFAADEGELTNIAVAPGSRRRGIARILLADVIEEAGRRGTAHLYLEVRASNQAALALYARAGFREVGRRHRYYSGPVEDAIVMVRDFR